MTTLDRRAFADVLVSLEWQDPYASHQEIFFIHGFNLWRDIYPGSLFEKLLKNNANRQISVRVPPGRLVPVYTKDKVLTLPASRLLYPFKPEMLDAGRYYPMGILSGIPGVFKGNMKPFYCSRVENDRFAADLNHPMAGHSIQADVRMERTWSGKEERGGACNDWMEALLDGPGMQSGYPSDTGAVVTKKDYERMDDKPDDVFYRQDRFVSHVDEKASENIAEIYRRFLLPGNRVLDLMASWQSHIPKDIERTNVHGLGMNEHEMKRNDHLAAYKVHDLNRKPSLPFPQHYFDAVICSLSIEYLVNPTAVFKEVKRVLKPGGIFAVTFSNRWFPEKVTHIWKDLHEFERMGLVLKYFRSCRGFSDLSTISIRGYPRPLDDKYSGNTAYSDPVYAVIGKSLI